MKKQIAVIGLGRFGGTVCEELQKLGVEVLAVDANEQKVNEYVSIATHAVTAQGTDEKALEALGIRNFDCVIVAIGDDLQASILTTLLLKEQGVKEVWVKAKNDYHDRVLRKIGADRIIHPERDMGEKIAQYILSDNIMDFIELSPEYSIVEVAAMKRVVGKTLATLDFRAKYGCNIIAIKRNDKMIVSPTADEVIKEDDLLVVIGANKDIARLRREG